MIIVSDDPLWVRAAWSPANKVRVRWREGALNRYVSAVSPEFFWAYDTKNDQWLYHGIWGEFHK